MNTLPKATKVTDILEYLVAGVGHLGGQPSDNDDRTDDRSGCRGSPSPQFGQVCHNKAWVQVRSFVNKSVLYELWYNNQI